MSDRPHEDLQNIYRNVKWDRPLLFLGVSLEFKSELLICNVRLFINPSKFFITFG
jgi:hypothetical protein